MKQIISAGHGGSDPGAVGNGLVEKDLTLDMALRVEAEIYILEPSIEVIQTRTSDTDVSLEHRTEMANHNGADHFLEIHFNAGGGTGIEAFIAPYVTEESKKINEAIYGNLVDQLSLVDRGLKHANFFVLTNTNMPALLLEPLFLDNDNDAAWIKKSGNKSKLAKAIAKAVVDAHSVGRKSAPPARQPFENLSLGSTGNDVKIVQVMLNRFGFYDDEIDGSYGPITTSGCKAFQEDQGIEIDGITGVQTVSTFVNATP